jgi:hypothetical protein
MRSVTMRCVLGKRRLGVGTYTLKFEGVSVGEVRGSDRFTTAPYLWRFGNGDAIVEIASSTTPAVGNVAGDLLAITTGATVGEEADTDGAVGQSFSVAIAEVEGRRQYTITAVDGRSVVVSNGGSGE